MFELSADKVTHIPSHAAVPLFLSSALEAVLVVTVVAIPVLMVQEKVPDVPTIMAFVASPPPPAMPPPPPPAAGSTARAATNRVATSPVAAPVTAPATSAPESPAALIVDDGVPGGVEGGIAGGVVGGVVGGVSIEAPPPPPPPPAPVANTPVRVGGLIGQPTLVKRVEPEYPALAQQAQISGMVILEAIVDEHGAVTDVRVLRSAHQILDREAVRAVMQWRYSPLTLNGRPVRFVLTVTLGFSLAPPG